MNSSIPSNSTGEILCPLDGRRSSTELYVKLFVVHFTTLSCFFHLAQRRDGKYLGWSWALYILAPLNIVFRYTLGLLGILIFYGCKVLYNYLKDGHHSTSPKALYTPLRWLFGKIPDEGYRLLPTSDNGNEVTGEALAKKIGKAFMIGAFLTQCAGAIFLYHRRQQRDAVTLFDKRVFELACGGLVLGILTIGLSFDIPIFKDHIPDNEKTNIDRFALFFRDSCSEHLLAFEEDNPHWLRLGKNLGISCIILVATYAPEIYSGFLNLNTGMWDLFVENPWMLVLPPFTVVILPVIAVGFYLPFMVYSENQTSGLSTILRRRPYLRWIFSPISAVLVLLYMYVSCLVMLALVGTLSSFPLTWFFSVYEVSDLNAAPMDVACPMLWSDPLSEYIWWLA